MGDLVTNVLVLMGALLFLNFFLSGIISVNIKPSISKGTFGGCFCLADIESDFSFYK